MRIVITGGAGFIGSNAAAFFLKKGYDVTLFDNLSRKGTRKNLEWIRNVGGALTVIIGDVRKNTDIRKLTPYISRADAILHLAAQVAVTTSVTNPREDFEINALGTFNVLESMRVSKSKAKFIYSSTNKVYGGMEDVKVIEEKTRYAYKDLSFGVSEDRALDFHSPYACSKGSADQYVRDYGRIYGLDTVVMRQSCIYGPRQFGVEDQGWVAWFVIAAVQGKPLTIYGNGKQVRDLLYIDDLLRAFYMVIQAKQKTKGHIYNIGGGLKNTVSIWLECKEHIEKLIGKNITVKFKARRLGDQNIFISDIRRAKRDFGWEPRISVAQGIKRLYDWVISNKKSYLK